MGKMEGEPVCNHPVMERLIWVTTLLEKLRPVDHRLQYRISRAKNFKTEDVQTGSEVPRVDDLMTTVQDAEEEVTEQPKADNSIYKAPKVLQVEYTGDLIKEKERAERELEQRRERLERSDVTRHLISEISGMPVEVGGLDKRSGRVKEALKKRQEVENFEEDRFRRI